VHLVFLTPRGALLALGAVLPLAALALNERRARRARRSLGVDGPPRRSYAAAAAALALVPVLLGLAVAQPVLQSTRTIHVRGDAQIFYVFDTSESMRAAAGAHSPTRLARALSAASRLHAALPEVPSGIATMTDRVLPNIFPTGSEQLFTAALADTVGIERPGPKGYNVTATTFASLDTFAGTNFFSEGIAHRLVILFTDGETAPYFPGDLHEALRLPPHTSFVIVRMGRTGDRIFAGGKPDRGYRPDPSAAHATRALASVVGGRAYSEGSIDGAIGGARQYLGKGPLVGVGEGLHVVALARWLVAASLLPLFFLLWRRNIV
jgi:von Willebrand factor type A domain